MAFKMKNPNLGKTTRAAGMSDSRGGASALPKTGSSPAKVAGYWEYDAEGKPQRISEADYRKKEQDQDRTGGRLVTAGKRHDEGFPGQIAADMSHGKAEIDKKAEKGDEIAQGAQQTDKFKKDVVEGEKQRGQRGTGKKTTRYAEDKKKQAAFEKEQKAKTEGGSALPKKETTVTANVRKKNFEVEKTGRRVGKDKKTTYSPIEGTDKTLVEITKTGKNKTKTKNKVISEEKGRRQIRRASKKTKLGTKIKL